MSIIQSLRDYLKAYSELEADAPVWVDHLGSDPTQYAVIPLAGGKVVATYLNGNRQCEYPFAFRSMESTADDLERLENAGFYEAFAEWLDAQTEVGNLPDMGEKKTAETIEAVTWGYLYEQGQSDTGVYQINCKLTYEQEP